METEAGAKARALAEALPWMARWAGTTAVVKYGGAAMTSAAVRESVAEDVALMARAGTRVVLVHGGGPEIDAMLRRLGLEPRFVGGLRYTDAETMDVVRMVLAGKVNKDLASLLRSKGAKALGLCGADGGMILAKRYAKSDLGLVGEIESVDVAPLLAALGSGYVPVVATVAAGSDGESYYNVNADTAAAEIAIALGADRLLLLTDVPGILRDVADPASLIREARAADIGALVESGVVSKGMIPKVECCVRAVRGGVGRAQILDGRAPHSLLLEAYSDSAAGTVIL